MHPASSLPVLSILGQASILTHHPASIPAAGTSVSSHQPEGSSRNIGSAASRRNSCHNARAQPQAPCGWRPDAAPPGTEPHSNPGDNLPPARYLLEGGARAAQSPAHPNCCLPIICIVTNNNNNNITLCLCSSLHSSQGVYRGITIMTAPNPWDRRDTPTTGEGPTGAEQRLLRPHTPKLILLACSGARI